MHDLSRLVVMMAGRGRCCELWVYILKSYLTNGIKQHVDKCVVGGTLFCVPALALALTPAMTLTQICQ